ncbi:uncharacterized protein OCT59_010430 [Rhizophagus irregularis]|nr:hypothetical protein OCT59_010430 [Rhizophagus irregularis]
MKKGGLTNRKCCVGLRTFGLQEPFWKSTFYNN